MYTCVLSCVNSIFLCVERFIEKGILMMHGEGRGSADEQTPK